VVVMPSNEADQGLVDAYLLWVLSPSLSFARNHSVVGPRRTALHARGLVLVLRNPGLYEPVLKGLHD
jgi:hypothetical protein